MPHSELATPSATKAVLDAHGLAAKKSFGQHFLVDDRVVGRILELASVGEDETVLEVGPGIGTLTVALCRAAGAVVAVERDPLMLPILQRTTAGCEHLAVVHADALKVSAKEVWEAAAALGAATPTAFVANLPYEVAATVLLRGFETMPGLGSATVMVQAEVADRIAAQPGAKDYGAYTVKLALRARLAGRFEVPRSSFMPPPRVESAVVRLERGPRADTPEAVDRAAKAARAAFAQRRKTVRNSLTSALSADKTVVGDALDAAGIDGGRRAETLSVEEYVNLGSEMAKQGLLP